MAVIPTMFGIAFGLKFLNQGGALVHIYRDGSVLVSHGGIEMGQGLYTKMIQIASKCLNIPVSKIHTSQSSTTQGIGLSVIPTSEYDSYGMNHYMTNQLSSISYAAYRIHLDFFFIFSKI